jgi:hypothetical protein
MKSRDELLAELPFRIVGSIRMNATDPVSGIFTDDERDIVYSRAPGTTRGMSEERKARDRATREIQATNHRALMEHLDRVDQMLAEQDRRRVPASLGLTDDEHEARVAELEASVKRGCNEPTV